MSEFERRMYIPEYDSTSIHLSVVPSEQTPEEFDSDNDLGRVYNIFDILSLGHGRLNEGLESAWRSLEFERTYIADPDMEYKTDHERRVEINEDGSFIITVAEVNSSGSDEYDVFIEGDIYEPFKLLGMGEGSMARGLEKVHEAIEDKMLTEPDDVFDINSARPRLDEDRKPLGEEIEFIFADKKHIPTD